MCDGFVARFNQRDGKWWFESSKGVLSLILGVFFGYVLFYFFSVVLFETFLNTHTVLNEIPKADA